jgi:hypothetical protein
MIFNNIARRLKKPIMTFIGDFFNNRAFYKKNELAQKTFHENFVQP